MGLADILNVEETRQPGPTGALEKTFRVTFTTEETSGSKTVDIPEEDFSPEFARQQAAERAEEIDAAFNPSEE